MSTHSPGPWTWRQGHDSRNCLMDAEGITIAVYDPLFPRPEHRQGDRALMAEAPELLKMLRAISEDSFPCPVCGRGERGFELHRPGCELVALVLRADGA